MKHLHSALAKVAQESSTQPPPQPIAGGNPQVTSLSLRGAITLFRMRLRPDDAEENSSSADQP